MLNIFNMTIKPITMKLIKTIVASCIALIISVISNAQEFQGEAHYFSKTTMDMDNFSGRQMSEEQKKQRAEFMKSWLEKSYVLTFSKTESIYKEEEVLEAPGQGGGGRGWGRMMMGSFVPGSQYKNVKQNLMLQEQEFFGKQFLIKEDLPKLEWKLESETKQIGQYLCMKATSVKKIEDTGFTSFRGRGRNNQRESEVGKDSTKTRVERGFEMPAEIIVTAWYTPQIPVSQGPGEFWGLPGLILEINADRTTILCSKIVINPKGEAVIGKPDKGKEVTRKEYNEIVKKKTEEMREFFRNRGRRGGNRRN
jgi:GLPGLI family protein